jgi:hypothetical protein
MDIKRWLKKDKGGLGAFLFIVIVGLAFYAIQREDPVDNSGLTRKNIKEITATKLVVARKPPAIATPVDSDAEAAEEETKPEKSDTALVVLKSEKETVKTPVKVANASNKPKFKAKPKFTSRKLSKEEIVRSKLRAGMSVAKIAKVTGYEKNYIRSVKKKKVCNCK